MPVREVVYIFETGEIFHQSVTDFARIKSFSLGFGDGT